LGDASIIDGNDRTLDDLSKKHYNSFFKVAKVSYDVFCRFPHTDKYSKTRYYISEGEFRDL